MRGVNKRNKIIIIIIYMYIFLEILDLLYFFRIARFLMYAKPCSIINFACKGNE